MKCVLHIGTEKTGTTILQEWLYLNKNVLSANGIFLSKKIGMPNNRLIAAYFSSELDDWAKTQKIKTKNEKNKFFKDFLKKLSTEIKNASKKHKYFIISSEHLHSRLKNHEEISALYKFLKSNFSSIEVICYFRNQYDVAVSLYSTSLKENNSSSLNYFIDQIIENTHYYNYLKIANLWSNVFGKDNCNFKIYDRNKFIDQDIRKDFIGNIKNSIQLDDFDYSNFSANESLSSLRGVAYKQINKFIPMWPKNGLGRNNENIKAKKLLSKLKSLDKGKIQSTKYYSLQKKFDNSNEDFFKKYFNKANQFKADPKKNIKLEKELISLCDVEKIIDDLIKLVFSLSKENQVTNSNELENSEIDFMRDLALNLYNRNKNNIDISLKLMEIAEKGRPEGILIKTKIKEWKQLLKNEK
jgi:hypothetical protein